MANTTQDLWVELSVIEISMQARFADIAFGHIDPKARAGVDLVFSSIHSFLSHCTMISKMLKGRDRAGAFQTIGQALGIPLTSVIHQRAMRNHLEHYDERLQAWIQKFGPEVNIGINNIGPRSAIQGLNMIFVSHYDPATTIFTFVNEDYDLSMLHSEAMEIGEKASNWSESVRKRLIVPPYV